MGTTVSMLLPERQGEQGMQIVRTFFTEWEQALRRLLPDSELSRLNRRAGTPTAVSDLLYAVLATVLTAAQATQGVYDPTLLVQLEQVGYDRTFDDLPTVVGIRRSPIYRGIACGARGSRACEASFNNPFASAHSGTQWSAYRCFAPGEPGGGWRGIRVNPLSGYVTLPAGIKLDFGGIAKGMAVDAALEQLCQSGVSSALVNAGGDLAVLGLPPAAEHWPIAVPGREGFWTIPLHHGAVATSGIAHRHWWQRQTLRHHLLDPRTGLPAQSDLWSVTVVADRCEQAEVAAKVAFILGSREGAEFLRKQQIAGLLVREDGTWETVEPWPVQFMKEEER